MPSPSLVLLRTQSDARLVALAREGHERAFEAIVERYRRELLRGCRRVLPEARAEDALQQALVAAWRGVRRGDEVRELRPWLHRIAHNASLNLLRQAGYDYDELQESLRITDAPDDELERRAVVRQTMHGLASLPPRQREALLAIAVEGRSQDEVAGDLGLSTGAVRQLVHRARAALRAAATAVVPLPLVSWVASAGTRGDLTVRIAELSAGAGGAGAGAVLAKAGTVAVIAGGAVAGPLMLEKRVAGPLPPSAAADAAPGGHREALPPSSGTGVPGPLPAAAGDDAAPAATAPARTRARPGRGVRRGRSRGDDDPAGPRGDGGTGSRSDPSGHGDGHPRSGPPGDDGSRSGPSSDDEGHARSGPSGGDSSGSGSSGREDGSRSGPSGGELQVGDDSTSLGSGSSGSGGLDDALAEPGPDATAEPEPDSSGPGPGGEQERDDG